MGLPIDRYTEPTARLDGQIVIRLAHHNSEEAFDPPRLTPRVADDPISRVVTRRVNAEAHHTHDMVYFRGVVVLRIDNIRGSGALVGLQLRGGIDAAGDGAASIHLRFHLVNTGNRAIITNFVFGVVGNRGAVTIRSAGEACILESAVLVDSLVVVARLIGDARVMGIRVDRNIIATVATAGVTTVNDVLWGKVGRRPGTAPRNVDAISKSRGGTHSPTRPAVGGDVLVASRRQIILAIDISPIPI